MTISAQGPTGAEFLSLEDGAAAAVSGVNEFRIRYNAVTTTGQISVNGGPYQDIPGLTSVDTGSEIWVDAAFGSDVTGVRDDQSKPFLTVGAALAVAVAGDVVLVRPGAYAESSLTLPPSVTLRSHGGWNATEIGDVAAVSDILTISDQSQVDDLTFLVPATAGVRGISYTGGGAPTASIYNCVFKGDGAAGQGTGIYKTGAGKIVGGNIRLDLGGVANLLHVDSGALALDDVHVPGSPGGVSNVILADGTGRFQGQGINIGNSNVGDCIHVGGTATCIVYSPNWFNVAIGGHIASDGVSVTIIGGRIDATVASLLVDAGLSGIGTSITVSGTIVQPLFSFPAAAIGAMQLNVTMHQEQTSTRDAESRVLGADLVTGFPEVGSGLTVGEGSAYSDGIKVVTTDGTEAMVGSTVTGGNQVDVTAEARSRSASPLTFQTGAVNEAIYLATGRTTPAGVALKHWGALINQIVAGVGGSYVVEIWNGIGIGWVEVGVQASSQVETYRYSSDLFLRALSNEFLQYGIDTETTWDLATVDGSGTPIGPSYFVRWRIATPVTTLPTFELAWLTPSFANLNNIGRRRGLGLALWRKTLIIGGNVFGESGGVQQGNISVGSGGIPFGWTQNAPNSRLNTSGDAIYTQLILPDGLCTAFPLKVTMVYSVTGGQPVTVAPTGTVSLLPVQVQGVAVADPAGGLVPIPRTLANTETLTGKAGQPDGPTALTAAGTVNNRALSTAFAAFDINGYYEGDLVLIRFEVTDDGTPNQDVTVWTIILDGVAFADGGTL